jgi:hypothetical protein
MPTFDKREEAFENRFAHDEELLFKILARAHKLIGLWAAEKLHKSPEAAENYANALVAKEVAAHTKSGVLAQIHKDFAAAGVDQSEHQIARHFEEFRAQAQQEIAKA